ncbi:hypothetical protein RhiirA5_435317 [Rhizophagus irregularis]|uniref:Uncharacterized protein n=1 Tax=Rhizophagus irregularis TaxID=588596 RepID=A0A2N0S708_9GLOM|nr:hypothetical protein RhiirA5_435317 [Rhizophagus irregularis]PKC71321.1 hypothetical protein RhiirA1_453643 [Rhizophagus irregularis]
MKRKDIKRKSKDNELIIGSITAFADGEETATNVDFKERPESSEEDENSEEDDILLEISFKFVVIKMSNENENDKNDKIYTRMKMGDITNTDATTDTAQSSRRKRKGQIVLFQINESY